MASKLNFQGGRIILGTAFSGYKFIMYEAGSSTLKTTYKDSALTAGNENTSTITLDSLGAAQIWFSGNAKAVFLTPADVVIYTDDNINLEASDDSSGEFNSVLNSSFEADTDGDGVPDNWDRTLYSTGAYTTDTTTQGHGQKAAKFTSVGAGGGYLTSANNMAVSPLSTRLLSFSLKSSDAGVRNTVDVYWYKADGTASSTASTNVYDDSSANPTSWTRKKYSVSVPSDAYFAKVRLTGCHSSDATAGSTWFDDIEFRDEVLTTRGDLLYMGASGTGPRRQAIGSVGAAFQVNADATGYTFWAPLGHISGLVPSNNGSDANNDIDVSVGECTDGAGGSVMKLTSAITKRLDANWAVGTNQGGLDTSSEANSTWYYIWLIMRVDTGVVDVLFSASSTAPTMPANYTLKRLIGCLYNDGSGNIRAMDTYEMSGGGLEVRWDAPVLDVSLAATLTTTARTDTMSVPPTFSVEGIFNVYAQDASNGFIVYVSCPDQSDQAPSESSAPLLQIEMPSASNVAEVAQQIHMRTSATGTIRSRSDLATVDLYRVATVAFKWSRR